MSPRASSPTFPPDDPRLPRPSHADSSHIARRRASSAPAHEVDLGEVELVDEAHALPEPPRSAPPPLPLPPAPRPSRPPFQVPIAVQVLPRRSALRRATIALASIVLALAIGAVAALIAQPRAASVDLASLAAKTTGALLPAPPRAPAPPAATNDIPVVNVASLPRASTGVVVGAAGHRLWIDGTLVAGWQATVPCGAHVVQVGSAGVPRTIEVPCGDQIIAAP
jgi:hypothetical protein